MTLPPPIIPGPDEPLPQAPKYQPPPPQPVYYRQPPPAPTANPSRVAGNTVVVLATIVGVCCVLPFLVWGVIFIVGSIGGAATH